MNKYINVYIYSIHVYINLYMYIFINTFINTFILSAYENWDDISSEEIDLASEDSDSSLEQYISAKDILITGVEGNIQGKS